MIQVTTNLKHAIAKRLMSLRHAFFWFRLSALLVLLVFPFSSRALTVEEATVADVQAAFLSGQMSARQLVTSYLERIAAYDQQGPYINSIINLNPDALAEADALDKKLKALEQKKSDNKIKLEQSKALAALKQDMLKDDQQVKDKLLKEQKQKQQTQQKQQ